MAQPSFSPLWCFSDLRVLAHKEQLDRKVLLGRRERRVLLVPLGRKGLPAKKDRAENKVRRARMGSMAILGRLGHRVQRVNRVLLDLRVLEASRAQMVSRVPLAHKVSVV